MKSINRNVLLPVVAGVIALSSVGAAQAQQERGRVISSTPVVQQVAVPQDVCQNQRIVREGHKSGAGAILGGIAGGAAGNAIGGGSGRAAATVLGIFGGAVLGNHIEGPGRTRVENVRQCSTETTYQNRTVGYNVVYEYAGRRYSMQTDREPGRYVPVNVTPAAGPASYEPDNGDRYERQDRDQQEDRQYETEPRSEPRVDYRSAAPVITRVQVERPEVVYVERPRYRHRSPWGY